jgi:hypothetical protein
VVMLDELFLSPAMEGAALLLLLIAPAHLDHVVLDELLFDVVLVHVLRRMRKPSLPHLEGVVLNEGPNASHT